MIITMYIYIYYHRCHVLAPHQIYMTERDSGEKLL